MAVLRIKGFGGAIPVSGDRALPDNFGVESVNTWFYGSEMRGIRPSADLITAGAGTRKAFRIPKRTIGGDPAYPGVIPPASYLGDSVWALFTDPDTDIVKGQLVEDSFERYYFCSPSTGPMFNTYARLLAGIASNPNYKLGVPGPNVDTGSTDTPTIVSITGGTTPVLTRNYVYTWINIYGEESNPSLPVEGSGNANATWTIGNIKDPPAAAGYAPYQKKRLYRQVSGTSGGFAFYKVADIALGTLTYADNCTAHPDTEVTNNVQLESTDWFPPPTTLKGFVAMPNGFLIGWDKNNLYFSESYRFHAWPPAYKQATETPIVGLGVYGQTCIVCTEGYPSTVTGTKPATCAFAKANTGEPCMSRGSIVSTPDGVVYASQNGLVLVGPGGIANVTQKIITKEEWLKVYTPQWLRAVRYQNGYLALRNKPDTSGSANTGFFLDPTDLQVALTELSEMDLCYNLMNDFWSGEVLAICDNGANEMIRRYDSPSDTDLLPVMWKSKEFQYPFQENFGAYAIHWDPARFSNFNAGADVCALGEQVRFQVYADRVLRYDQVVPLQGRPVRLPSGFKAELWQFVIRARAPVYDMHVASTMKELKQV